MFPADGKSESMGTPADERFAEHYPAQCPPAEATGMNTAFFRFASENPENLDAPENYKSYAEMDRFPKDENLRCNACGLSGFLDVEELEKARNKLQKRFPEFAEYPVYILDVSDADGLIKQTKSNNSKNHYTFWVYISIDILSKRRVV